MSDSKGAALLVAVTHAVRAALRARSAAPANGSGPLYWPLVAQVMAHLTGEVALRNRWRNRYDRATANLSEEAVAALVASVAPETYRDAVRAVVETGEAPAGAPPVVPGVTQAPAAMEDEPAPDPLLLMQEAAGAPRNEDWRLRMSLPKSGEPGPGAQPGDARDALMEALVNVIIQGQEIHRKLEWRKPVFTWDAPDDKPIGLVFLSDTHIGNAGVDYLRLREDMNFIRDTDGLYATHLGDWTDNFNPKVIPQGMLSTAAHPADQWGLAEWFLRTQLGGSKKMPAAIEGNHDDFGNVSGVNECRQMLRALGVRSLGPGGRIWVRLGSEVYKLEVRHHYNYNSSLNESNSQRRLLELTMGADAVWFGHLHVPTHHYVHRGEIDAHLGRSGTHKIFDYWAEQKGFKHGPDTPAPDMGMLVMVPNEHRTLGFRNFRHGLHTLAHLRSGGAIPW